LPDKDFDIDKIVKLNHGFQGPALADEITELRLFVAIVQAGNLSAASRALNASTAAMSRGLSNLESRLGVCLVTRTTRSFELTEEGRAFYERCERIIVDIDEAEAEASSKGNAVRGNLRIGAPNGDWKKADWSADREIFCDLSWHEGPPHAVRFRSGCD
jgi:Bacterial regulatory helix-turn-helix protein, lysR family